MKLLAKIYQSSSTTKVTLTCSVEGNILWLPNIISSNIFGTPTQYLVLLIYSHGWMLQFQNETKYICKCEKILTTYILLGSYYMYWSHKCSDWYFLDQPVRIFVNGGKFSNQYSLFQKKTGTNSSTDSLLSFVPVFFETDVTYNRKSGIVVKKTSTMDFYWDRPVFISGIYNWFNQEKINQHV